MVPESDLELGQLRLLEVDNKIVVPANAHIRIVVSSTDVIHDFAVPSLGLKIDALNFKSLINIFLNSNPDYLYATGLNIELEPQELKNNLLFMNNPNEENSSNIENVIHNDTNTNIPADNSPIPAAPTVPASVDPYVAIDSDDVPAKYRSCFTPQEYPLQRSTYSLALSQDPSTRLSDLRTIFSDNDILDLLSDSRDENANMSSTLAREIYDNLGHLEENGQKLEEYRETISSIEEQEQEESELQGLED